MARFSLTVVLPDTKDLYFKDNDSSIFAHLLESFEQSLRLWSKVDIPVVKIEEVKGYMQAKAASPLKIFSKQFILERKTFTPEKR